MTSLTLFVSGSGTTEDDFLLLSCLLVGCAFAVSFLTLMGQALRFSLSFVGDS